MQNDSSCSAFRYDPLKRKPKQPVDLPQFEMCIRDRRNPPLALMQT